MNKTTVTTGAMALVLLLTYGVRDAGAATIEIAATVSDRGSDAFPWDGIGVNVFGSPSVVQITTPPIGTLVGSEERTAVEFPLAAILGSTIDSVSLRLSPVGQTMNIGLGAGEVSEVHGYSGDGAIQSRRSDGLARRGLDRRPHCEWPADGCAATDLASVARRFGHAVRRSDV